MEPSGTARLAKSGFRAEQNTKAQSDEAQKSQEEVMTGATLATKDANDDLENLWPSDDERVRLERILGPYYRATLNAINAILARLLAPDANSMVVSDAAVVRILGEAAARVVRIDQATRAAVQAQLQLGQLRGYSTWQIAHGVEADGYRGIDGLFEETWRGRADTVARTELQHASVVASRDRFVASGVVDRVRIIDGDEWDTTCANRHGTVVPLEQAPSLAHPNCLVGGQIVWAPNWQAGSARWFDGEVVVLRTAAGDLLTATPNHPILTPIGWQPVGVIRKGDCVARCAQPQRVSTLIDPNHQHRPSVIEQVVSSCWPTSQCTPATVPLAAEAFHGEATPGDVCVIWTDRRSQSGARKVTGDPSIRLTDAVPPRFTSRRSADEPLDRVALATASGIGVGGVRGAVFSGSTRFTQPGRDAHWPRPTAASHPLGDSGFVNTDNLRDLTNAHLVEDVEVVEVGRFTRRGYVYNLQTSQGWYIASNLITHNCTLVLVPVLREDLGA